jgi:SAM-dependent methyltransferase
MSSLMAAWHDVECGAYDVDLEVWRALAAAHAAGEPVLDVGAGTGRVALHLAGHGHAVVALDTEPVFLDVLRERGEGLPVATAVGDARTMALDRRFALIIAPMQTVQLLGGADGRAAFFARAREHLVPGGVLAAAIAHPLEAFDAREVGAPAPDLGEADGLQLVSRPVAIRDEGDRVALVREREAIAPGGATTVERDVIHLDRVAPDALSAEGAAAGLRPAAPLHIPATPDYIDSTVLVWHA